MTLSDGRHIVLGDRDGPHRIWLRASDPAPPLAYSIARDCWIEHRWNAARRLDRRLCGGPPMRLPPGFQPTGFQRHRLGMLLRILDDLLSGQGQPTTHEIALRHVYPGMDMARGSAWKASSERRRTRRLIEEALALMRGGYLGLLATGGTKVARPK